MQQFAVFVAPRTWSVYQVAARFVHDVIDACLTEKDGDVEEGGSLDGKSSLAVPNNVLTVWIQAVDAVL